MLKPDVFDRLPENADEFMWEQVPLEQLTVENELMAYKHKGFWKCMDAARDKSELEELWKTGQAKWKIWV